MSTRKKRRPKPILDRLPIRPPFTRAEWKKMTVADVVASRVFLEYFGNCLTEAARSDRAKVYLSVLTGIMHFGRLPDFAPRSLGKFLAEAEQQTFSLPKLEIALEAILGAVAERQIPLGLVGQFEFLATVGDFANHTAEQVGTTDRLTELTGMVMAAAMMSLAVAINAELGCLLNNPVVRTDAIDDEDALEKAIDASWAAIEKTDEMDITNAQRAAIRQNIVASVVFGVF
jgi:hypothetical protein